MPTTQLPDHGHILGGKIGLSRELTRRTDEPAANFSGGFNQKQGLPPRQGAEQTASTPATGKERKDEA